jgi:hypothetical protein
MPDLPPDLREDIVRLLCPLSQFKLPQGRLDLLDPYLGEWEGRNDIDWTGGSYSFFQRFVLQVPEAELDSILRNQDLIGVQDMNQIEGLRRRMARTGALVSAAPDGALTAYSQLLVRDLSSDRRQLDSRFVQLTLLLDQGPEVQGKRFVQAAGRGKYDSLVTLLDDIKQRAVVLLGRPGSGKTTLLRRLQLEKAWLALEKNGEARQTPFFISLNGYRGAASGEPPPHPYEWLEREWRLRFPQMPPFEVLFQRGDLLLLLDGLNEMPHRDKEDYETRIGMWQTFLQQAQYSGNNFVFSCRSLDYSASLSSEALPVPQVDVEPLAEGQIKEFLYLHLADDAELVWTELRQDQQQLELFATPFFLQLLVEEVEATGEMPGGQAALLTGFVRRTLHREVVERRHRLFLPDLLLSEFDVRRVIRRAWTNAYDLPEEGLLIPKLESLAYKMQDKREAGESAQVRLPDTAARELIALPQAREIIDAGILDIAMAGTSATLLARKWESALLVNVDNDTLRRILNNPEALAAVERIEGWRSLGDNIIETIINKSEKIKDLKKKGKDEDLTPKETKELTAEEKEFKSKRKQVQEKLIKFATRIPAFMYLTDFRENTLQDVITKLEPDLFRAVTGLTVEDFHLLVQLRVFNTEQMNQAVFAFRRYEDASLRYTGIESHAGLTHYGLYDTVVARSE